MKILSVIPQETYKMPIHTKIPKRWTYFVETNSYVKSLGHEIKCMDCLEPSISHAEIFKEIAVNHYDVVLILIRSDGLRNALNLAKTIKEIAKTKVLAYGDVPMYANRFLKKYSFDAIIYSGDFECSISDYIQFLEKNKNREGINGLFILEEGKWYKTPSGHRMENNLWSLPTYWDKDICSQNIFDIYNNITDKEITISIGRGCPFICPYCPAVATFGGKDRRIPPNVVVDYIQDHNGNFRSFKLFCPTFTLNKEWVKEFCRLMLDGSVKHSWCCTSRVECLKDEKMIALMAETGCTKVAIGIETMDKISSEFLGKYTHKNYIQLVVDSFQLLSKYKIEPKPLMMLGIKGQSKTNLIESFKILRDNGATSIRCASYSPKQIISDKDQVGTLTIDDVEQLDKMTYQDVEVDGMTRSEYLELMYTGPSKCYE